MTVERIVGIDPSSTRTGLALLSWEDETWNAVRLVAWQPPGWLPAEKRVVDLGQFLDVTLPIWRPEAIGIELPAVKQAGRLRQRAEGLAIYGMAVGVALYVAANFGPQIAAVDLSRRELRWRGLKGPEVYGVPQSWTERRPKRVRLAELAVLFPEYGGLQRGGGDPGGDIGDAVGVALWLGARLRAGVSLDDWRVHPWDQSDPKRTKRGSTVSRCTAGGRRTGATT